MHIHLWVSGFLIGWGAGWFTCRYIYCWRKPAPSAGEEK